MKQNGIRAVVFDWGGVLLNQTWKGQMEHCASRLGVFPEQLNEAIRGESWRLFVEGRISERRFWQRVCAQLGIPTPSTDSLWYDAFHASASHQEEMWALIPSFRERGIKVGLLSNLEIPCLQWLEKNADLSVFDATVFSCLEGMSKPDRRIFGRTAQRLQVEPQETVVIDDREDNFAAASALGMRAIRYESYSQLQQELSALQIGL